MKTSTRADGTLLDILRSEGAEVAARLSHLHFHGCATPIDLENSFEQFINGTVAELEGVAEFADDLAEHVLSAWQRATHIHSEITCEVCRGVTEPSDPHWSRSDKETHGPDERKGSC